MDKETALSLFYKKNKINIDSASNECDGNYDCRLAALSKQVDHWLANIDIADHKLFLTLLSNYTYLTAAQCQIRYSTILSLLQEQLDKSGYTLSDVLFVSIKSGGAHKTGSDNVRADLYSRNMRNISKRQIIASQSKLTPLDLQQYKAVVFLDDIVGSGITLWKCINDFYSKFLQSNTNYLMLYFSSIAPRKRGIKHIQKNCKKAGIEITPLLVPSWYEEPAFHRSSPEYIQIEKYEQIIGTYMMDESKSFFMGFQRNRLLISFYYNTPNNTLSTFWRVVPATNDPPFYRDGNQPICRPSIDDLRKRDMEMRKNAYAYGQDIQIKLENHNEQS